MKARGLWLLIAAIAAAAGTARLGWWQLDRAAQKEALQQRLDQRRALPPLQGDTLPRTAADVPPATDRAAVLQGRWLAAHTVHLDNRQHEGRPGFYAVTPLQLADGGAVLVQRGWLPRDMLDRTRIARYETPAGEVRISGRVAERVPRLFEFDPAASQAGPIRQNLDLDSFALETRLVLRPWVLIQDDSPGSPADGLLRRWQAPASGVAKHHGYAFQWFALSALVIGLYVWFQLIRPRRQQQRP
jgi:surfeit locus 1 family protein